MLRSAHEAIAFGVRGMVELLHRSAGRAHRVVAVGGGLQGGLLTQLVSDVCGIDQLLPEETIGACYGDALLAAIGVGLVAPDTDWTRVTGKVAAEPGARATYDELAPLFDGLYRSTTPLVHALADRQAASHPEPGPVSPAAR